MLTSDTICLPLAQWQALAAGHRAEVRKWTQPYRRRKASHRPHPVCDFLFTYYPFSPGRLEQWHPGYGVVLECTNKAPERYQTRHYRHLGGTISLDQTTLNQKQTSRLKWIHNLLSLTQQRTPHFACHGLHEWAMVYGAEDIRHRESTPLRLSQREVDQLVETRPISCSHFDAYRFFSSDAIGLNKLKPTLETREQFEQCGCLHTNMDLYKWASKCMPWVGSELLWQCFQLALKARELDMCASPYDLSAYGYQPVKIETPEGRRQYETRQREISRQSVPLRQRLMDALRDLILSANA